MLRWRIAFLVSIAIAISYLDRQAFPNAFKAISLDIPFTKTDKALLDSAFLVTYGLMYIGGGKLMDFLGTRKGFLVVMIFWSLACASHGIAAGFWMLAASRLMLGIGEGGGFPAATRAVAEWFPVRERALATGWFNAGTNVGAVLCPLFVKWMYDHWGWQTTFYATGATGFLWVAAWLWIYETPEKHPRLAPSELAYIKEGQQLVTVEDAKGTVPVFTLLRYRAVWAYLLASIFAGPAWGFYQFFLPDFLKKAFHLDLTAMAWWTSAFFFLAAIGGVTGGWLAGWLLARGWTVNAARKCSLLACALAVVPVFFAPYAGSVWLAVVIVGLAGSAHQGWSANLFSVVSDTMPRQAISSVVGLGGFLAYFTGGFVNEITGQILQKTGSYVPVFAYFSGMYVLSLLLIQILVPHIGRKEVA